MKTTLLLLLIISVPFTRVWAQTTLHGLVHDNAGKPLPFATVALLNARDSGDTLDRLVKERNSDAQGLYAFENVQAGEYLVRVTAVGYQKAYSSAISVTNEPVNVPTLTLTEATSKLAEVKVTAKKPFIEQQIDRMVVNVAQSIVGSGSTALEVLEKAPGVTVDYQNERLQLRGKDGVIVQIDGRQMYLSQQEVITLLRSMSSDNIETVELITNPGARYDAAGNSGIINIRLKKNSNVGTNGTISIAGGSGRFDRERGSLQLNHRANKLNLFGSYSLNRGGNYWDFLMDTNQPDPTQDNPNQRNFGRQTTYLRFRDLGQNAKAGLDFSPNQRTTIGLVWTGLWSDHRERGPADAVFRRTENGPVYLRARTEKTYDTFSQNQVGNLNVQHSFGEKHGQVTADVDLGHFSRQHANSLLTETLVVSEGATPPVGGLLLTQPTTIDIRTAKVDYNRLLPGGWKLETGLKTASVKTDNDLRIRIGTLAEGQQGRLQPDPSQSNRFQYTERVNAGYVSMLGKLLKKTDVQIGLRVEQTHSVGHSLTLNQRVERNYLKWFPSLFVNHPLAKGQTLTLSYSYRIDRPSYQNLNPARGFVNPFAFSIGNAYLQPQFTHSTEAKYTLKNNVFASLAYSRTTDLMFFTIHPVEGNKTYVTFENLGLMRGYTLTLGVPLTVMKGWQLQTNWLGYYNRFQYDYEGTLLQVENVAGRLNANNAFTLGKGWTAELNGWVSTPAVNGIWRTPWVGSLDVGVQKAVGTRLKLKLSGQDVLHTNQFIPTANTPDYQSQTRLAFDTRIVLLNLTYSFGNQQIKSERQRRTASEDETRRAN
ncbi:TonB-dependent receptor plug [Fibrisoma limi BUZ 3]|uniref:TonB-dependent receptor plug n=1 Tax=Fibrisoma limi BUZ 3 TaxID=1185876 RepID=I2GRE4_9BACT|nr:outer membrane beta-barrel family protein [Fibrisoma limi]CCH56472.1 TonB-dependent receptor plug [Fibrisoma limi BUZ 3]